MRPSVYFIATVLLSCSLAVGQAPTSTQPAQKEFVQIQAAIPAPPTVFRGSGAWHLCYEIHLTNWSPSTWTLQAIVVSSDSGTTLLSVPAPLSAAFSIIPDTCRMRSRLRSMTSRRAKR